MYPPSISSLIAVSTVVLRADDPSSFSRLMMVVWLSSSPLASTSRLIFSIKPVGRSTCPLSDSPSLTGIMLGRQTCTRMCCGSVESTSMRAASRR